MNEPNNSKVAGLLDWWLDLATAGLLPADKARIAEEIRTHFAEAVEYRVVQGEPQQKAEINALNDLGDPGAAAKRFRSSLLTEKEMERLAKLREEKGKVSMLLWGYLSPLILLLVARFGNFLKPHVAFDATLFLALFVFPIISLIFSRPVAKARLGLLLLFDCFGDIAFVIAFLIVVFPKLDAPFPGVAVPLVVVLFSKTLPGFLTWNKLHKMGDKFDETTGIAG